MLAADLVTCDAWRLNTGVRSAIQGLEDLQQAQTRAHQDLALR